MDKLTRAKLLAFYTEQYLHQHMRLVASNVSIKIARERGGYFDLVDAQAEHDAALQDVTQAAEVLYCWTFKQPGVDIADHRLTVNTIHEDRIWTP